ncbi:hypothetical protein [Frigoriflavimonas asaccharolytica]|uniref:Uncharacterized protein n=1 Tax=Frigoriflavimonas asaccharolytica TaxID=2735899 RepID=A0A8J8K9P4_9FLAO|nr:hypothetical protein [Frigoriflavimonas asaccharolytica]NRS93272.1 hypothetical protein [Frigoriflavimonas asaccharolytica]
MKKTYKIAIPIIGLIILGFIFNPFYWLMQPMKKGNQPELSKQEKDYFQQLTKKYDCGLKRLYINKNKDNEDTLFEDQYDKIPFIYSLSIDLPKVKDISDSDIKDICLHIKNEILNNDVDLTEIIIYKNYDIYRYLYDAKLDSLVLKK